MNPMLHRLLRTLALGLLALPLAGCGNKAPSLSWSPDGRTLATDWQGRLRLVDTASGKQHVLATTGRRVAAPTFSPDGTMLAYYVLSEGRLGQCQLWVSRLAAHRETCLARNPFPADTADQTRPAELLAALRGGGPSLVGSCIAWRPDSRELAYVAGSETGASGSRIGVMDLLTGRSRFLGDPAATNLAPHWSPSGELMSFIALNGENQGHPAEPQVRVRLARPSTGATWTVRQSSLEASKEPFWPIGWGGDDRTLLVAEPLGDGAARVTTVNMDNASRRVLATIGSTAPPLSQAGEELAFVRSMDGERVALLERGGTERELGKTPPGTRPSAAVLSPGGDRVAVALNEGDADQAGDSPRCRIRIYEVSSDRWVDFPLVERVAVSPQQQAGPGWLRGELESEARAAWLASRAGRRSFAAAGLALMGLAILARLLLRGGAQLLARR